MTGEPRRIESRRDRLRVYLAHNRERIFVDLIVLVAWIVVTRAVFGVLGLPQWLFYLVLLLGVFIYTRVTPPWERPYRSPDLEGASEELPER